MRYSVGPGNEFLNAEFLAQVSVEQLVAHPIRLIRRDKIHLPDRLNELLIFVPVAPVDVSIPQPVF